MSKDYDDAMNPPGEILDLFWRAAQEPSVERLRYALGAPPELVLKCIARGYLSKAGTWTVPELTTKGREHLRGYRTCQDCRQECVETIHHYPARRGPHPYRASER